RVRPGSVRLNANDPVRRKLKIATDLAAAQESGRTKVGGAIADCETRWGAKRAWDCSVHECTIKFLIDETSTYMTTQIATAPVERYDRSRRPVEWRVGWRVVWKICRHRGCCDQRGDPNSCNEEFFHDPPPQIFPACVCGTLPLRVNS